MTYHDGFWTWDNARDALLYWRGRVWCARQSGWPANAKNHQRRADEAKAFIRDHEEVA